ncbi:hypothetical protein BJX64DRAFT_172955 [Aspergillus heterothallicus]
MRRVLSIASSQPPEVGTLHSSTLSKPYICQESITLILKGNNLETTTPSKRASLPPPRPAGQPQPTAVLLFPSPSFGPFFASTTVDDDSLALPSLASVLFPPFSPLCRRSSSLSPRLLPTRFSTASPPFYDGLRSPDDQPSPSTSLSSITLVAVSLSYPLPLPLP